MGKLVEPNHDLTTIHTLVWDQFIRALAKKNHPYRTCAFTTTGPNSRMVILRAVDLKRKILTFYTDSRSSKYAEILKQPLVSLLFWHPTSRFQSKLSAKATLNLHNDETKNHWNRVGAKARESYNTNLAPGEEISSFNKYDLKPELDSEHFCVINCEVREMEILQLNREGHTRARFLYKNSDVIKRSFLIP